MPYMSSDCLNQHARLHSLIRAIANCRYIPQYLMILNTEGNSRAEPVAGILCSCFLGSFPLSANLTISRTSMFYDM